MNGFNILKLMSNKEVKDLHSRAKRMLKLHMKGDFDLITEEGLERCEKEYNVLQKILVDTYKECVCRNDFLDL